MPPTRIWGKKLNKNLLIFGIAVLLIVVVSLNGCVEQSTTNNKDYYFVNGFQVTGDINKVKIIDVTIRSYHEKPYEVWDGFPIEWNSSNENKEGLLENPINYLIAVNGTLKNLANETFNSVNLTVRYYCVGNKYLIFKPLKIVNLKTLDERSFWIELSKEECWIYSEHSSGENWFWRINNISFSIEVS